MNMCCQNCKSAQALPGFFSRVFCTWKPCGINRWALACKHFELLPSKSGNAAGIFDDPSK